MFGRSPAYSYCILHALEMYIVPWLSLHQSLQNGWGAELIATPADSVNSEDVAGLNMVADNFLRETVGSLQFFKDVLF
jgi:hypothetical protein